MPALDSKRRSQLDDVCQKAREKAEEAARSALQKRAVDAAESHAHFTPAEKELRNRLRARGRQAGDVRRANKTQGIEQLVQELAYEYWHRMLFARLLAENHLLMHPDGVAVSLEECEELANSERASNGFVLAARYASKMLPQVFRTDDVLLEIEFAPEHRLSLEKLLASLPRETFVADDSLGWVYQFWQSKRKDDVNKSGKPIDGPNLPAVTQLFTEDYMVQFLLHNTIGAWWCARQRIEGPSGGAGIPTGKAPVEMPYLRWRDEGTPAAGTFDGWPKTLQEFKMLDPCCGSGHFLVAAFNLVVPLRMHDEGISAREACDAVLCENLFGLELDPRCTQIAAFALAFAAWKYPGENGQPLGYRELPTLNIACTGIGPQATEEEWLNLAEQSGKPMTVLSREPILNGLRNLHALFSDAPTLGSLIDPNQLSADLITADYETLQPYLAAALTAEQADDDSHERAVAAAGMAKAAELLAGEYTLVTTNVPFLGYKRQGQVLRNIGEDTFQAGKADLATMFVQRIMELTAQCGCMALVTPRYWMFLHSYTDLRKLILSKYPVAQLAFLGPNSFETISGEVVNVSLVCISTTAINDDHSIWSVDVTKDTNPGLKDVALRSKRPSILRQQSLLNNPKHRITAEEIASTDLMGQYAIAPRGIVNGDIDKWTRCFWEIDGSKKMWRKLQSAVLTSQDFGGRERVIDWSTSGEGMLRPGLRNPAYSRLGVAISRMSGLPVTLYTGELYDQNTAVLVPLEERDLLPLWTFCSSEEFPAAVRVLDQKLGVTPATLLQVGFDVERWREVAATQFADGLPEPHSDDPTQWLFNGDIATSTNPLQVAVARLLGYRWPDQPKEPDSVDVLVDQDGVVCIPALREESPADERLMEVLQAAYGLKWSTSLLHNLLTGVGCMPGAALDEWLRNTFFEQHCNNKLFRNRPFIWQIWDGRKDGFSCLLNYHKLNYNTLYNLTHSYLKDWIGKQAGDAKTGKAGADLRLAAAQALQEKLKLILAGEPPYDIFVRWKPLHKQPIGWNPDLNDGARINIRPFVEAGILRKTPNIKWTKDRGSEPERDKEDFPWFWDGKTFTGERVNDIHLTNAKKQAARERMGG